MSPKSHQALLPGMEPDAAPRRTASRRAENSPAASVGIAASPSASNDSSPVSGDVPDLIGKSVWAVDAHSLIFQVFHAIPEMSSPKGQAVNAVYGFTRDVLFLLETKRPDYFFCAFDMDGL